MKSVNALNERKNIKLSQSNVLCVELRKKKKRVEVAVVYRVNNFTSSRLIVDPVDCSWQLCSCCEGRGIWRFSTNGELV